MRSNDCTAGVRVERQQQQQQQQEQEQELLKHEVPIVEVGLRRVTYAPVVAIAGNNNNNHHHKNGRTSSTTRKTVLSDITTTIRPYQLTAWMGPSGSGKTSLISVVADLVDPNDILQDPPLSSSSSSIVLGEESRSTTGTSTTATTRRKKSRITVNGEWGRVPKRLVGVVWQDDLLLSNLTVEENVYFAARLGTPVSVTDAAVRETVSETLQELGLLSLRHTLVGGGGGGGGAGQSSSSVRRGVSGGERKRVSVAQELVVRPSLLLLDEPTSGLDATTAHALVKTLRHLTAAGHAVVLVIHQPRTAIYSMFDRLLLLSRGQTVYDGPPGTARAFLESCPTVKELPAETGIADWMMDVIAEDERRADDGGERFLPRHWSEKQNRDDSSPSSASELRGKEEEKSGGVAAADSSRNNYRQDNKNKDNDDASSRKFRRMSSLQELHAEPKFHSTFRQQLKMLTHRTMKQQRGERLAVTNVILQFSYLFFTALFWWRLPDTTRWIYERMSVLFFMMIAQANGIVVAAVTVFQRERALLRRERAKKMYGVLAYFLSKTASDMTNNVLLPVSYGMVVYWTANLHPTAAAYGQFFLALYSSLATAQSMGLFLSIAIPSAQLSLVLAPPITLFFMIMGGFYIPFANMHPGVVWLSWLSFARYGYSALLIAEFQGRYVPCAADENDDDDKDISSLVMGGGQEGGMTSRAGGCPMHGDDVVTSLGITGIAENYWFNVGMVLAFQVFFRVTAYALLLRSKKN